MSGEYLDEYVSFELPTTRVTYGETPTGRLRFVLSLNLVGPYQLQQQWRVVETRQDTLSKVSREYVAEQWRDVPIVEEGAPDVE